MQKGKDQGTKLIGLFLLTSFLATVIHFSLKHPFSSSQTSSDHNSKPTSKLIFVASSIGLLIAAATHSHLRKVRDRKIIPQLRPSKAGRAEKLERFPHYVGNVFFHTPFGREPLSPFVCVCTLNFPFLQ
uniref:Transmembrane protein n=1 Tax=Rhizophora mucronata TaxID=61149 RepID=A0A2P2N002_RHIMU